MEKKNNGKVSVISSKKLILTACILVISIVVIAFSLTYAYFSVGYGDDVEAKNNSTAIMDVTSSLINASAINETRMNLINPDDVSSMAKTVSFDVTNEATSNVNVKYVVKLIDYSLTKNLSSKYFKWKLVVNPGTENAKTFDGDFLDAINIAPEGTDISSLGESEKKVSNLTKFLITEEEALPLEIGHVDNLIFSIWLENDDNSEQNYLTNGEFTGRLSLEASPVK